MKICPNCKKSFGDDQVFCGECGTKLENKAKLQFCPQCGKRIPDVENKFCPECGCEINMSNQTNGMGKKFGVIDLIKRLDFSKNRKIIFLSTIVIAFCIFGAILFNSYISHGSKIEDTIDDYIKAYSYLMDSEPSDITDNDIIALTKLYVPNRQKEVYNSWKEVISIATDYKKSNKTKNKIPDYKAFSSKRVIKIMSGGNTSAEVVVYFPNAKELKDPVARDIFEKSLYKLSKINGKWYIYSVDGE